MKIGLNQLLILSLVVFTSTITLGQKSYYIYSDGFVHGLPTGKMGSKEGSGIRIDSNSTQNVLAGKYSLKVSADSSESWSGLEIQYSGAWKNDQGVYANLSDYKYLVLNAKSTKAMKIAKLGVGENGREETSTEEGIALDTNWKRIVFELPEKRSSMNGLLIIVFQGAGEIYLDELFYADAAFQLNPSDLIFKAPAKMMTPDAFYVYADHFVNGIPSGFNGEKNGISIKMNPDWRENPYYGNKCIKMDVSTEETWRGFYIFSSGVWEPSDKQRDKCPDLSTYDALTFYAKADRKRTFIREIGMGELARDNSEGQRTVVFLELTTEWKKYEIRLNQLDKSRVNTLLFMILDVGTIYFDEIKYIKSSDQQ